MLSKLESMIKNLRESDKDAVLGIVRYFQKHGLNVEMYGSASDGKLRYHDVDLLVVGNVSRMNESAACIEKSYKEGSERYIDALLHDPNASLRKRITANLHGKEYEIISCRDASGETYVGSPIIKRMLFQKGSTLIDVSFSDAKPW